MTDPGTPTRSNGDATNGSASGDGWVTGPAFGPRRVPGIDDVPETTYMEPRRRHIERRTWAVSGAIVFGSLVICGALVAAAGSKGGGSGAAEVNAVAATLTSTTTRPASTTTTTGAPASSGSGTPASAPRATTTTTVPAPVAAAAPVPAAPTPPATANPAFDPYQAMAVPLGVRVTIGPCSWRPDGGGVLQAGGNIASHESNARTWTVTAVWLQNNRELARQSTAATLAPSEVGGWALSLPFPNPPADLACAVEVS